MGRIPIGIVEALIFDFQLRYTCLNPGTRYSAYLTVNDSDEQWTGTEVAHLPN